MSVREEEIKNILKEKFFSEYDWTKQFGNIDLAVCARDEGSLFSRKVSYLWCETKQSKTSDLYGSFIQLILTIGKEKTYQKELPPFFLGAADATRIAFVDYSKVMQVFSKTDFNWNVTPSDHGTKEFKELYALLKDILSEEMLIFKYAYESKNLRSFIRRNFKGNKNNSVKIPVTKTNFTFVYYEWLDTVWKTIAVDLEKFKESGLLQRDFFLADLMSLDNTTIFENLKVVLDKTNYKIRQNLDTGGLFTYTDVPFKDNMRAHRQFWNIYERPPKKVYQKYILDRYDLLVPQYVRETKGSYYTPSKWVVKAHDYLEKTLGDDWQDEYFIWDCAGGTGNLVRGLTNKYNIFVSTLDESDVNIMYSKIDDGALNLVKENVFQFDFLNDDFSKCPEGLQEILSNTKKREKLIFLINPPYRGSGDKKNSGGKARKNAAIGTQVYNRYSEHFKKEMQELYGQFFIRIASEVNGCVLASFSSLKFLKGDDFENFRSRFNRRIVNGFVVPSYTFDNVDGKFPIGFFVQKIGERGEEDITIPAFDGEDVFVRDYEIVPTKSGKSINDWLRTFKIKDESSEIIGYLCADAPDFQDNRYVCFVDSKSESHKIFVSLTKNNLLSACVYLAARQCVDVDWLNNKDSYMFPSEDWKKDRVFHADCVIFSILNGQNKITGGKINHFIPYYEKEISAPTTFRSRFMADYLKGKIDTFVLDTGTSEDIFSASEIAQAAETPLFDAMSPEAKAVYEAGKSLWKYYMSQPGIDANASFYDIKKYFKGTHKKEGKEVMNTTSSDTEFNRLMDELNRATGRLADALRGKVYRYGFLLK